jgi:hypothetical protein
MKIDFNSSSHRIIIPYKSNLTPSVQANDLTQDTIDHAYFRLQIYAMLSMAYHKTALRSSGKAAPVTLKASRARFQGGRGSNGTHAAHAHIAAGLCDDRRKQIIKEIRKENAITPRKKRILKAKGFSERQLKNLLKTKLTKSKFKALFNRVWPQSAQSLVEGTTLNLVASATTQLPAQLNWQCDLRLERKIIINVFLKNIKELMQGASSPEISTKRYCADIQAHFRQSVEDLQKRIKILKKLKIVLKTCSTCISATQLAKLERAKSKLARSAPGAPKATLSHLGKFISELEESKKPFKRLLKKHRVKVKAEITEQIKLYEELLSYASNELKGTEMPPFAQLTGEYHAVSNSFVPLTPTKAENLQMKLLRPTALDSPPPKLNSSKRGKSKKSKVRKELF